MKPSAPLRPPRPSVTGTLSYIFNTFGDGRKFSEIVQEAKAKGYTEPDPRDDLNGTDVARKVQQYNVMIGDLPPLNALPEKQTDGGSAFLAITRGKKMFWSGECPGTMQRMCFLAYPQTVPPLMFPH